MSRRLVLLQACALLTLATPAAGTEGVTMESFYPREERIRYGLNRDSPRRGIARALLAVRDVRLRDGQRVRPRLCIECAGGRRLMTMELPVLDGKEVRDTAALRMRLAILDGSGKRRSVRGVQDIEWPADTVAGVWSIPDSSEWLGHLGGATGLTLLPEEEGPVGDPIDLELSPFFASLDSMRAACRGFPVVAESVFVEDLPEAIAKPAPTYPEAARLDGLEGMVVIQALVDREGRVARSFPRISMPAFDDAALEATRGYRFRPARKGGEPIAVWVMLPVRFVLR